MKAINKTISATILVYYYDKYAEQYDSDYPQVKNPAALVEGIEEVTRSIGDGDLPDNTLLYIIEDDEDRQNPYGAQYVIMITKGSEFSASPDAGGFAVRLFYTKTQQVESISSFEDNEVIWSPDNMTNTKHPNRTKYYLGFAYMLCEKSPGFDQEPMPEKELTGAELIALGVEGELPPELIEISLPDFQSSSQSSGEQSESITAEEEIEQDELALFDDEADEEVPEFDDTEIIIESPYDYDNEYDDLATDYEELFES